MRVSRVRKLVIKRKKIRKLLFGFLVFIPSVSAILGYIITDLIILPLWK